MAAIKYSCGYETERICPFSHSMSNSCSVTFLYLHKSSCQQNQEETEKHSPTRIMFLVEWLRTSTTCSGTTATAYAQTVMNMNKNKNHAIFGATKRDALPNDRHKYNDQHGYQSHQHYWPVISKEFPLSVPLVMVLESRSPCHIEFISNLNVICTDENERFQH